MGKETVSLKLDTETAGKFKMMQKKFGSAQDFAENVLPILENQLADSDSLIQKEKMQLQRSFQQTERIALSFLEITANEKKQVIENAESEKKKLQEKIDKQNTDMIDLKKQYDEQNHAMTSLKKKYKDLQESVEVISELKIAWRKLEESWKNEKENFIIQIAQLKKKNKKK